MVGEKEKNGRILQKFIQGYVRIRSWQCSLRVPQKQNFQSKNKRVFWNFPTEIVQNTLTIPNGGRLGTRTPDIHGVNVTL